MVKPESLDAVREIYGNYPFPRFVFNKCQSALMFFCAGFYGGHDCLHVADAGLKNVLCVDIDEEKLLTMRLIYPDEWTFFAHDVYDCNIATRFDLIVADVQLNQIESAMDYVPKWCEAASKYFVMTVKRGEPYLVPIYMKELGKLHRSDTTSWLILGRK